LAPAIPAPTGQKRAQSKWKPVDRPYEVYAYEQPRSDYRRVSSCGSSPPSAPDTDNHSLGESFHASTYLSVH
jgi:hypothetical protein